MLISSWLGAIRSQFRAATSSRQRYTSRRRRQATRRRDHRAVAIAVETLEDKTLLSGHGLVQLATPGEEAAFDFGTSSSVVEAGYIGVTGEDRYDAATGYGWLDGDIRSRDRGASSVDPVALTQDLNATADGTFLIDVAAGTYDVTVTMGDPNNPRDGVNLYLEGELQATVATEVEEFFVQTFTVEVDDGQLTLHIQDGAQQGAINALTVSASSEFQLKQVVSATGESVQDGQDLDPATTELTLRFNVGQEIDPASLSGIQVTRAGGDGEFGDGNDVVVASAATGLSNEVNLVFFGSLPDDVYRITLPGSGPAALGSLSGEAFNGGVDDFFTFTIGAQQDVLFDFGTSDSTIEAGYEGVTGDLRYSAAVGYGWLGGDIRSRDRGANANLLSTALMQDLNATAEGTFVVDVDSGTYDVTVTMGDALNPKDGVNLYLEGVLQTTVATEVGEFYVQTFTVDVDDGQLTLRIQDDSQQGSINAMTATPSSNFQLHQVTSDVGGALVDGDILDRAPNQLTLVFDSDQTVDPNSLGAISVTRAGMDNQLGDGDDIVVTPTSISIGAPNEVIITFADSIHDDLYQLRVDGSSASSLKSTSGEPFNGGVDDFFTFAVNAQDQLSFDFGTTGSALEDGYARVTGEDQYNALAGFGWTSGNVLSKNRGAGSDPVSLMRDLNMTADGTFVVDVASGTYEVTVSMGDNGQPRDGVNLSLEGELQATVDTAAGEFFVQTFLVVVDDGQLTLQLQGSSGYGAINALTIATADFELDEIRTDAGQTVLDGDELDQAPSQLTIRFDADQAIDPNSLDGIRVIRAGLDDQFGDASDVVVALASASVSAPNEVTITFADALPDDLYQVAILGSGQTPLRNTLGVAFNHGSDEFVTFALGAPEHHEFDFGTSGSALESRYTGVTGEDRYDASAGYGWLSGDVISRNRGSGADPVMLTRDFNATADGTFVVDVTLGTYEVTVTMGDNDRLQDGVSLFLEGELQATFSTAAGEFSVQTYVVDASDGQLTLSIQGSSGRGAINALAITAVESTQLPGSEDFELEQISTDVAGVLVDGDVLDEAPAELEFVFASGQIVNLATQDGITLIRAGLDGLFGDSNDVAITLGAGSLGGSNELTIPIADLLPNDLYRITIAGSGATPLQNTLVENFNGGVDVTLTFTLDVPPPPVPSSLQFIEMNSNLGGPPIQDDQILNQSPTELTFLFGPGQVINPATLNGPTDGVDDDGIQVVRAGADGVLGTADDVTITPGFIGLRDIPNDVVVRFVETLPDDLYQVTIFGTGLNTLQDSAGNIFNDGVDLVRTFELDLGAQVVAIVPQPVTRQQIIEVVDAGLVADGDTISVTVAGTQVVFELEDSNGVAGVDSGNIAIDFTSGAGGTTATAIAAAIAAEIDALLGVGAGVTTGAGGNPLITITGVSTTPTVSVAAADPAAFTASEGGLKQNDNVIVIHFNEDDLDPDSAINPDVYQLIDTKGTLDITDDDDSPATLLTSSDGVVYDSVANTVTLTYDAPIAFGTYRLRIGVSDPRSTSELAVGDGGDLNSSFDSATLFNSTQNVALGAGDLIVINSQIQSQSIALPPLAGGVDEPGHRQIPVESHVGSSGTTPVVPGAISQLSYNFQDVIGSDPQGNTLFNLISEEEKVRAREIFEIYAERLGIEFIETPSSGLLVATGDMRAVSPVITVGPGGVAGISGGPIVVMDPADTSNSTFGGSWQRVAFHEIGHSLGLGHSYDIPSVQGAGLTGEGIFTGDHDFTHLERLFRPDSTDIDLYEFDLAEDGLFTAEVFAERLTAVSLLNSALTLYRENADGSREVVARNDDYFSNDAYLELNLTAGTYFVGVTSTGNLDYDPTVSDTGSGGTTDGNYELRFSFLADPIDGDFLIDSTGTAFDGDADGIAGGVHEFFFQAGETIFVDKATASTAQDGTLDNPYSEIDVALENVTGSTDIIRIVGNGGADGDLATPEDSQTYQIGFGDDFAELEDGITFIVPQGVTVMIDQGAVFKLQNAIIDVGSSSDLIDRSQAALQILGTPDNQVVLTSNGNDAIGGDTDGVSDGANPGDWGGVVFRGDSDLEDDGVFLNYVNQADITFGGGQVLVSSVLDIYNPIHVINARPTISFNTITQSADAAISASLESFADTIDGNRDATLSRIGLDVHGNTVVNNSINGLFVAVETVFGNQIDEIDFFARFDDTDIVHVVTENIQLVGSPGGPILVGGALQARESGRLRVDASTIVKLSGARIEGERGHSNFIAEGTEEQQIIFTSIFDDRYGRSGTSDTTNDTDNSSASSGDWGGFVMNHSSNASIDQSYIAYGGGLVPIEGGFDSFNVIEVHQADLRLTNSRLDSNANGSSSSNRNGRGTNDATTIFIRGAQPIIVGNDFVANDGSVASVNANSMTSDVVRDLGRSTGVADAFTQFPSNYGPLVRLNRVGSTIALPAPTRVATELITNGGFETGDFTGWTLADTGSGNWSINDGTFDPDGPGDALPPISGNFDAITAQAGPGLHLLSESIGVPSNIQSAVLSWSDRIRNDASEFSDPNQEWRVLILDSSGNLIQEIFSTDPGDPLQQIGPNNRSFDITSLLQSLEGEQIRLSFEEQNDSGFFNVTLDDVSLQLETGSPTPTPAPSSRSNGINGIEIRAEELTVESVWDDTDIVHVLRGDISIPNFHTYGGLRLESSVDNSLVVKLSGANAGFTATGRGLDINDRIGGSLQIVGQPLNPVVLTSLSDDTIGAGLDINGLPQNDTNGDGAPPSAALAPASSSSDGHVHDDSHSHDAIDSIVVDSHTYHDSHLGDSTSDVPTINFGESLTIFGPHHTDAGHPGSPTTHFFAETGDADHFAWQDQDLSTPNVIDINYDFRDLNGVTNVITPGQITMAELALRAWENATAGAINFVRNTTAPRADVIIIGTGNLSALGGASGVGGTLGLGGGTFTHNANHTITAGSAWQDSSETWDENFNNGNPTGTFDYFTIAAQEIGHAIGLGHTTDIAGPDLMDGSYTGEQTVASVNDIAHVQVVYGVGSGGGGTGAVAQPGDWRSVRLEQFSNDRNVEVFNELEGPLLADLSDAEQNAIPPNAQFLGELAPDEEHGDENRRLGFEVYGFIAADDSGDTDVYSFNADAGSQIWIDIDRTDPTLNAVVELLDPLGNVLAQSINNTTFSGLASSLIEDTRLGGDFYTSNPNDPGMRLILPGVEDQSTTYFIRVRSNSTDLSDINGGLTTGNYQLQVRVNQVDDQPGSTIQYADIRFATNGIEILGLPGHSPLVGEAGESSAANNTRGQAQNIGNLLDSDRNTISVGGSLSSLGDVDFYQFTIDYDLVQAIGGANNGDRTFATIFDIDYADGLSRPDTTLSIFDASGNLIYVARDSNIEDDQPRQTEGVDFTDDLRGSVGELDPFIGSIQLPAGVVPAGSTNTYFVAVSQQSRLATALNATFIGNSTNTTVRLEPINSIQRIVEDHIGSTGYLAGSEALESQIQVDPVSPALFDIGSTLELNTHVTPFTLGDVQLFVHTGGSVLSIDPLRGTTNYTANSGGNYGDIAMRWDGVLFGYTLGGARAGGGTYSAFDLGSNTRVNLGNSGIAANPGGRSTAFDAMAFSYSTATDNFNGPGIPSSSYAFNNFAFDVDNDVATPGNSAGLYRINADTGAARDEDVNVVGHQANINRLFYENAGLTGDITGMAFTSITGGTLLGVDDTGNLWNMFGRNIIQTNVTETGVGFTGLTNGPQNLLLDLNFDGNPDSLADVFFATGTDGSLYALDANGTLVNVWDTDGDNIADSSSLDLGLGNNTTGLAFSTLDFNLWHTTDTRGEDAGHGINTAPDFSRDAVGGGTSFYFGMEGNQHGVQSAIFGVAATNGSRPAAVTNSVIGGPIQNNYNLPGGAHGSLTTNSFSLEGYDANDRPTMYFNYFIDTQGANSDDSMLDSARVFVSDDGGLNYTLLTTNNSILDQELADILSVNSEYTTNLQQQVQELHDNTGDTVGFRQARVDLGEFVGESNLTLRFDFNTAGSFNIAGDITALDPSLPGEVNTGDLNNRSRASANDFEGFYIDDIIIGFAERGEMVTNATAGLSTFFVTPDDPDSEEVTAGTYQLEIRRGTEYGVSIADAGSEIILLPIGDTNTRLTSGITLIAPAGSAIADGDVFTIFDGVHDIEFEFNNTGGVLAGRVAIGFNSTDSDFVIGNKMAAAINTVNTQFPDLVPDFAVRASSITTSNLVELSDAISSQTGATPLNLRVDLVTDSFSENGGSTTATINREGDNTLGLTVTLTAIDPNTGAPSGDVTLSSTMVTFAAGSSTSASFTITGVDNAIADGAQSAFIQATVIGFTSIGDMVDVIDDETATLILTVPTMTTVVESAAAAAGGVTDVPFSENVDIVFIGNEILNDEVVDDFAQVVFPTGASPFTFDFFGTTYTELFVNSHGLITFGSGTTAFLNDNLTGGVGGVTQAAIAPLWDNWSTSETAGPGSDAVYAAFKSDPDNPGFQQLVIRWESVPQTFGHQVR